MVGKLPFLIVATIGLLLVPAALAAQAAPAAPAAPAAQSQQSKTNDVPDADKKICEKITPVGSRLASKRVCATRAEWADKRRQDREETEKAQRLGCLTQSKCGGN